ncbi:methylated-DNA--[protein]-cysteine S-methyltransferase [Phenylobacterium montanum]|uniref:Methylated-DNA--protein-cysteine methyltransferase n=1 Tax=Phenylobacterium montanum TaxID=2823693 RepID=A0A975G1T1_9CAUL|nr:methylated-DNA--[protein]-cysteine S-methyltransferase [Caulobacter sp. S6]QUD89151.1 methylated-DNA--[protein]-cysteine S-methyltransferase [Caulobacter sp. S6]
MPAKPPERLFLDRHPTPIGVALLVTDEAGVLRAFDFEDYEPRMRRLMRLHYGATPLAAGPAPAAMKASIDRYFSGDLKALDEIKWATAGTEFQRSVWRALTSIGAGETLSYRGLAERVGRPKAVRAVGLANGSNPVALVVPCHRVIGADGSLTGYGGGLHRKQWLLEHELAVQIERP